MLKIGAVSHSVPPSPSGQAVMLGRLLSHLPPESYVLISRENYQNADHSTKLPAKYYYLKASPHFPEAVLPSLAVLINALYGIIRRAHQIGKIISNEKCNLLLACTGDLYDLPAAYLASKWYGLPIIPYIFDDYVYQWTGIYRSISKKVAPPIMKGSNGIIVANEWMQDEYLRRYGVSSVVIRNPCVLPDLNLLDQSERFPPGKETLIVYTGAIYHAHYDAFHNLIAALRCIGQCNVRLHLYTAQSQRELAENGIAGEMVTCHPHIPYTDVPRVLRQADILFLPLAFDSPIPEVIRTSAPGKMGEYLASGRPVLAHAPPGTFISWYLNSYKCGVVVNHKDPKHLANAIRRLLADSALREELGQRARERAKRDFEVCVVQRQFIDFIQSVARDTK